MKRRAISLMLILAGSIGLGQGGWIWAKAQLAQVLLDEAWGRTLAGADTAKPWPWADTWPVARLRVPAHGAEYIVLAGASGSSLAFGPGHLDGSAVPGTVGNTVISAHRDTHFRFLQYVNNGDIVVLEDTRGVQYRYHVTGSEVVDARHHRLRLDGEEPHLTLVTCWPFDAVVPGGPMRYVVHAKMQTAGVTPDKAR